MQFLKGTVYHTGKSVVVNAQDISGLIEGDEYTTIYLISDISVEIKIKESPSELLENNTFIDTEGY